MVNFFSKIFFISLISTVFFGCASTGKKPEPEIPRQQALAQIEQRNDNSPETMRINARVDYVDEINNKRVVGQDLILSSQKPSQMRITISAFDKAIATLVSDGERFSLIDVGQNVFVTGTATPENISKILPVYLSAADLYRVIFGGFPTDGLAENSFENQTFTWDEVQGGYDRALPMQGGLTQHVYYAWPSGDIFRITVASGDEIVYRYDASEFKNFEQDGVTYRYPSEILFNLPRQKTDVRLRIDKRDIDVEFSSAVFKLVPPNGARVIEMD